MVQTDQILQSANKRSTNTVIRQILSISEINQFVQYLQFIKWSNFIYCESQTHFQHTHNLQLL